MPITGGSPSIRWARTPVPYAGVVNAASLNILARGRVTVAGGIQAGDAININIGGTQSTDSAGKVTTTGGADYKYTVVKDDTIDNDCQRAGRADECRQQRQRRPQCLCHAGPRPRATCC